MNKVKENQIVPDINLGSPYANTDMYIPTTIHTCVHPMYMHVNGKNKSKRKKATFVAFFG